MVKQLVTIGDSWTYGSEIRDPSLPNSVFDWDPENDAYRLPKIWPTKLGERLNTEVVNLSFPAASNDRSVRVLTGWLTQEYLTPKKPTDDLFVIVGLTSPERKDFYYKETPSRGRNGWMTIWPMWEHKYYTDEVQDFVKLYVSNFWSEEESTSRYIQQLFYLQTFFKLYNIKYLFFQAFYQFKNVRIQDWVDSPYQRNYRGQVDHLLWEMIDPVRFLRKNDDIHSFHNYISSLDNTPDKSQCFIGQHPSELGHTWWANHIFEYCQEHNLW